MVAAAGWLLPLDLDLELLQGTGFLPPGLLSSNSLDLFRQLASKLLEAHRCRLECGADDVCIAEPPAPAKP